MDRFQFLEYTRVCLGVRTLSQTSAENKSTLEVSDETPENKGLPLFKEAELCDFFQSGPYRAIFLRVNDERKSLSQDPASLELFEKLRRALGYSAQEGPWIEVSSNHWFEALGVLRTLSESTVVFWDESLGFKAVSNSEEPILMVPDPALLVAKEALKRPTWDLLKEWKSQGLTDK